MFLGTDLPPELIKVPHRWLKNAGLRSATWTEIELLTFFFSFSLLSGYRKQRSLFKTAEQGKGMYVGLRECWGSKREEKLNLEVRETPRRRRKMRKCAGDKKADGAQTEEAHLENRFLF